jgi:5-methylcytosine-specific restriction enzyme A
MAAKTHQSFSSFCENLDCKLDHIRQSWSGYNPKIKRAIFTVWDDRLDKKRMRYVFSEGLEGDPRFGAKKLLEHIKATISLGGEAFGIRSIARNIDHNPRGRKSFDQEKVFSLRLTEENGRYVAYVQGEVSVQNIKAGRTNKIEAYPDAIDDLDSGPPGSQSPVRTSGTHSGYSRDPKIRNAVLKRAKGICEFCGERGFEIRKGEYYVEAHHIIHLAKEGPDTMKNVIALCSNHHREAHYGLAAEALELELLTKLKSLRLRK